MKAAFRSWFRTRSPSDPHFGNRVREPELSELTLLFSLKNILMATDLTDFSQEACDYARELCARFQATLHLLHVIDDQAHSISEFAQHLTEGPQAARQRYQRQHEQTLVRLWQSMFPNYRKGYPVTFATRFGEPEEQILRYAREQSIDLIVAGTHGRAGLDRLVRGSVAEYTVRRAPCPVLTIHSAGRSGHPDTPMA